MKHKITKVMTNRIFSVVTLDSSSLYTAMIVYDNSDKKIII